MPNLSAAALMSVFNQNTDKVWLHLVDIVFDSGATFRYVNNNEPITHNGNEYTPKAFKIGFPKDNVSTTSKVKFKLELIDDPEIRGELRSTLLMPTVSIRGIIASEPDTVAIGPVTMTIKDSNQKDGVIQINLSFNNHLARKFPAIKQNPYYMPGLFR